MTTLSERSLDEVTSRIINAIHPRTIYLYGSHAYGEPHVNSDIDLLVVVDAPAEQTSRIAARGYAALQGLKIPLELNVVSNDGFERRRHWRASVEREVAERGRILHGS